MQALRVFLNERLTAAAEEIFGAVERTIAEYKEEICRSKDLEIHRLKMQLKILKSADGDGGAHLHEHIHHLPPPPPPPPPPQQHHHHPVSEEEEAPASHENHGSGSERPEPSQVKKEQAKGPRDFWMSHDSEQLEELESDIKDFISAPVGLKGGLHEPALNFHFYHGNDSEENKERPYTCSVCEKCFNNCSHLAAHIRTHTGERPYRCEICRKSFITTSALNRHQTIHTEGKHFVCNYCGKSFKWMDSLGRHMRIVHKRDNMPE